MRYKERRELLDELSLAMFKDAKYTSVLEVLYQGTDLSKIDELLEQMVREDTAIRVTDPDLESKMLGINTEETDMRNAAIIKQKKIEPEQG